MIRYLGYTRNVGRPRVKADDQNGALDISPEEMQERPVRHENLTDIINHQRNAN